MITYCSPGIMGFCEIFCGCHKFGQNKKIWFGNIFRLLKAVFFSCIIVLSEVTLAFFWALIQIVSNCVSYAVQIALSLCCSGENGYKI